MMKDNILNGLSPSQHDAVTTIDGPVLVLAGAGSGKTRVITRRIAHMIENGVRSDQIMAVTFTNKAANEMAERVRDLVEQDLYFPYMGTFHSVCYRFLRKHADMLGYKMPFTIYDADKSKMTARNAAKKIGFSDREEVTAFTRRLLRYIERYKNEGRTEPVPPKTDEDALLFQAAEHYTGDLRAANAMDFGDLLLNTLVLLQQEPNLLKFYQDRIKYVMVDEFQDTNPVQYHIVKFLSREHRNLCVVGDDDQSIYSWRGATISNILNFDKDFEEAKVVYLVDNYRSNGMILKAAAAVVAKNRTRHKKNLRATKANGQPVVFHMSNDANKEAAYIADVVGIYRNRYPNNEIAIFFRTNAQSRPIEQVFVHRNIPYRLIGAHKFFDRKEIRDMIAYLDLVVNPHDEIALRRVVNEPPRKIGTKTIEKAADLARENHTSLFDAFGLMDVTGMRGKAIKDFIKIIDDLHKESDNMTVHEMLKAVLARTGYKTALENSKSMENQTRVENVEELVRDAREFTDNQDPNRTLDYLAKVSLHKGENVEGSIGVNLMTVHSSKGLEFSVVIIAGLVEGLFPHKNSLRDNERVEEERRLMYVAMTRAKERLLLSAYERMIIYGAGWADARPSRFLDEIPIELIRET